MDSTVSRTQVARTGIPLWFGAAFLVALVLIGMLYWGTFSWWWYEWTQPGSFYAHAMFVPFFVGVMIYRNRERLGQVAWNPSWSGVWLLIPAMALLIQAQRSDVTVIKSISFMLLLLGAVLLLLGKARTHILLFPLIFVAMMMPLVPDQLINSIAFPIQMTSAKVATFLLNCVMLHATREGTLIQMESYKMAVELPCSGFKTLVSLLTFSAAFAYLVEAQTWKRWTLFLVTGPLSLFINALRIFLIGVVGELVSSKAAGIFHDWSGFIVLILAFMFLFNFARLLNCERFLGIPLSDVEEEKDKVAAQNRDANAPPPEPWWQPIVAWRPTNYQLTRSLPYVVAIDAILLVTLGVQAWAIKPIVPLPPIATVQVPEVITQGGATYTSMKQSPDYDKLTREVQEVLNPTRIINRDYSGSDGAYLQLFISSGNGRKVFHDPHTCFMGSNSILEDQEITQIPTQHGILRVQHMRAKYPNNKDETEVMVFYVVEEKIVQSTSQVRNSMILQTLLGDSGKPSYFVRVMQKSNGTEPQKKEQLVRFITGLWNEIGPVLTGKKPAVSEPPPVPVKLKD